MQARLRLVEHHELGRTRRQHHSDEQQVAQGAVGEFRRSKRTQQPMLAHFDGKPPAIEIDGER